jgi:hypothetical protein
VDGFFSQYTQVGFSSRTRFFSVLDKDLYLFRAYFGVPFATFPDAAPATFVTLPDASCAFLSQVFKNRSMSLPDKLPDDKE